MNQLRTVEGVVVAAKVNGLGFATVRTLRGRCGSCGGRLRAYHDYGRGNNRLDYV